MPNDDHSAAAAAAAAKEAELLSAELRGPELRWFRTFVEEARRFQSLRPLPGRVHRFTPLPPELRERLDKSLACWPVSLSDRRRVEMILAGNLEKLAALHGYSQWPEAGRIAVTAEAHGFDAANKYAAGKSLATDEERADVFKKYLTEMSSTAKRWAMERLQGAGTSRSGPAAQLPPAASSVAVVSGPVQQPGMPSASVRPSPSAPEE